MAAAIGLAFLAYSNSFHGPFLMDNNEVILKDTRVHAATADHVRRILDGPYWEVKLTGLYRPLVNLSFLFNYAVLQNEANSFGYHLINFALHAVNIGLVYALGLLIFESIAPAFVLAALWGAHPVLTESVTNLVGRADLLAAFGVLAALLCYTKAMRRTGRSQVLWLVMAGLASAVGIFSKESAIVAVAVLVLYDLSMGGRAPWRWRVGGYAAVVAPSLVFLAIRAGVLSHLPHAPIPFTDNPLVGAGFWTSRLTAVKVIGYELLLLLWPGWLSSDYSYHQIPLFTWNLTRWEDLQALLALLICIGAAVLAFRVRRTYPRVSFAIGFFFIALSPTANIALRIGSIMAERFLYLPSIGFLLCVVCGFEHARRGQPWQRKEFIGAAGLLLISAGVRTYGRNNDWLDEQRFWKSNEEAAPNSYKPHIMAARAGTLDTAEGRQGAAREADRALNILAPLTDLQNVGSAYRDAGALYRSIGDRMGGAEAGAWYRKSLTALQRSERIELARDDVYRRENGARGAGLTFLPADLYLELGRAYLRLEDSAQALAALEHGHALESDPDLLEELSRLYRQAGNLHAAAAALVEAFAVDPSRTQLAGELVELYGAVDPSGCAVAHTAGGPELNVRCPLVHSDICRASANVAANYVRHGQTTEAAAIRRVAASDLGCGTN